MKHLLLVLSGFCLLGFLMLPACRHELGPLSVNPVDPVDTSDVDVPDLTGWPCSADTAYFQNQILPLITSNCSMAGCHDAISHKEGITLTNYDNIVKNVKPFNGSQSKLYKVVIDNDPGDRMPPPPAPAFTAEQKALLKKWIDQGAKNNRCNESYGLCDTTKVTYTGYIQPLVAGKCQGCHGAVNPSGGLKLSTYAEVKASAQTGLFYGSIVHSAGVSPMPQNGAKLSNCQANKVKAWISAGMKQ